MSKFPKKQKLCNEKTIQRLFMHGEYITEKPFKVIYNFEKKNENVFVRFLIVVSKKRVKLAVKRNYIKRRIKEACRLHKKKIELLLERNNKQLNLAIIYQQDDIIEYKLVEKKINSILTRLIKKLCDE